MYAIEGDDRRQEGFWTRLGAAWRRFRGRPRSYGEQVERREMVPPVVVPAKGGVYSFTVYADIEWSASNVSPADFRAGIDRLSESAWRLLQAEIWPLAADYVPHDAAAAREGLFRQLNYRHCLTDDEKSFAWRPEIRVVADQRVLDHQVPYWQRYMAMDAEFELAQQRIRHVTVLEQEWQQLIERLGAGPTVVAAARLTDVPFAQSMGWLAQYRAESADSLIQVLREGALDHQRIGLFEFADAYDRAMRIYEKDLQVLEVGKHAEDPPDQDRAENQAHDDDDASSGSMR